MFIIENNVILQYKNNVLPKLTLPERFKFLGNNSRQINPTTLENTFEINKYGFVTCLRKMF